MGWVRIDFSLSMAGALRLENVLKRAEELEAMHMEPAALDALYETVASKRTRAMPLDQLEPVFAKFLSLACDLRRGKMIKDGLHQYKRLAIAAAGEEGVVALERAVDSLLRTSAEAVARAQTEAAQTEAAIDDLDEESPQGLMLALVTSEEAKDRTDRELVTPWLKFLWENYRSVLDVLRNNSKLETSYARVASEAFRFCAEHNRKTEFRRLAELLRTHLQYAATQSRTYHADLSAARAAAIDQLAQQQGISTAAATKEVTPQQVALHMPPNAPPYPIDLSDADTLQRFLDTRFEQLERAVALELWQETYRSIEDVHTLLSATRRPIPVASMATYYETLARVFAVSQNHLFHAATWFRYFAMLASRRAPESELRRIASFCVLSLLCVAPTSGSVPNASGRTRRWMNLINLTRVPTRELLVEAVLARNVLSYASPELRALFNLFQPSQFNALTLKAEITKLAPYLAENKTEFQPYFAPMLEVAATSVFGALAQSYTEAGLDFVLNLVMFPAPFETEPRALERLLVRNSVVPGAPSGYEIRIDHGAKLVRFVDSLSYPLEGTAGAMVRSELYELAKLLARATAPARDSEAELAAHGPEGSGSRQLTVTEARAALIAEKREHQDRMAREVGRDRELREAKLAAEEEQHRKRVRRADELRAAEEQRAAAEEQRIQEEVLQRERAALDLEEKRKLAISINSKGHVHIDLNDLEKTTRAQLQKMQVEQVEQETKSLDSRMAAVARRYDHLERALREEEAKLWQKEADEQHARDQEIYDKRVAALLQGSRRAFEEGQAYAQRFVRIRPEFHAFKSGLTEAHANQIKEQHQRNQQLLAEAKEKRLAEMREAIAREEEERRAEEQRRAEEHERIEKERIQRAREEQEREANQRATYRPPTGGAAAGGAYRPPTGGAYRPPTGGATGGAYRPPTSGSPFGAAAGRPAAAGGSPFGAAAGRPAAARPAGGSPFGAATGKPPASASSPFGAAAGKPPANAAPKTNAYVPVWKRNQQ